MVSSFLWLCSTLGISKLQGCLLLILFSTPAALAISQDKNRPIDNWEIREWMNDVANNRRYHK